MVRGGRVVSLRKNSVLTHSPVARSSGCSDVTFCFTVGLAMAFPFARFAAAADTGDGSGSEMHQAATLVVIIDDKSCGKRRPCCPLFGNRRGLAMLVLAMAAECSLNRGVACVVTVIFNTD